MHRGNENMHMNDSEVSQHATSQNRGDSEVSQLNEEG